MKLLDCPFCGGAPQIHTQMSSRYQFVSCSRCRCDGPLKERTRDAISHWNRRASPTPPTGREKAMEDAQRIVDWDDGGRLADDEWLVERNETAIIAICRALLSSPRVEEVRRDALEEAAKVADEVAADERAEKIADKEAEGKDYDPYSYGAGFLDGSWVTAQNIAKAIRSLSLPDGEGKEKLATRASGPTAPTDR